MAFLNWKFSGAWPRRNGCELQAFYGLLFLLLAGLFAGPIASNAEDAMPSEYQVKAAFLINFPKYMDWPATAFATATNPVIIAVSGETKVAGELEKIIAGRIVNGRGIVLKRLAAGESPGVCHILFISAAEQKYSPSLIAKLKRGVLSVGESDDFLEHGGIINLTRHEQKISLEVNLTAATAAGIKISSQLLKVAGAVKGKTQ
jgi:YfiR/HmsC-like